MKNALPSPSRNSGELPRQILITILFILSLAFRSHLYAQDGYEPTQNNGTGVVTVVSNGNSCLGFTAAVGSGPDNWEVVEGGSYTMTISGVTECNGDGITVFVQNSSSGNFCFNAWNDGDGNYSGSFTVPNPTCNTMPISYKCGADQSCDNSNTWNANGQSNNHKVHLRASNFDANCTKTSDDENCAASCTMAITFTCKKPKCHGDSNGNLNITVTGAHGNVTYLWSNGATTEDISGIPAGTYTVTATDESGCSATLTRVITEPSPVHLSETHVDVSTNGGNDGSINITSSGGSGRKSYSWNDGSTKEDRSGLSAGTYTATATDHHGCSTSLTIEISQPDQRMAGSQSANSAIRFYPNPVQDHFTLEVATSQDAEGEFTVFVENLLGQIVYSSQPEKYSGNIIKEVSFNEHVNDGMYVVHVIVGNKEFTEHLMVQQGK